MTQDQIDQHCLRLYDETRAFKPIADLCLAPGARMGFEILMGPPHKNAPLLFIGYQPGDWVEGPQAARAKGYESSWVTKSCQYAHEQWLLARRMRRMFGLYPGLLERSVGLNAVFVRAKSIDEYKTQVAPDARRLIEEFCLDKVRTIVELIGPLKIVVIGFSTMEVFREPMQTICAIGSRRILGRGRVFGRPAFVTPHLSAARGYSNADRELMAKLVVEAAD
jgi:hypothetical protein